MARPTKAEKRPTWTSLVQRALEQSDDFMTVPQLIELTKGTVNQVAVALSHLKKHRVVDCLESDGKLYWFANHADSRTKVLEERTPEPKGSRHRKKSIVAPK